MKTIKLFVMTTAAIAAVSCAKEISPDVNTEVQNSVELCQMTFSASSENESKAILNNRNIEWTSGDAISIFDGSGNRQFTTTDEGATATFEGLAAVTDAYYALYPYQAEAEFFATGTVHGETMENYFSVTIPTEQVATAGSFDPMAFLSIAKADEEGSLRFNNLLGLVQFRLADAENVASVTLSGNDAEQLSGHIYAYYTSEGKQKSTYGEVGSKAVTLKGEFVADTDYYFAVRTCGFEKGVTISVEYKDGETVTRKYLSSTNAPVDADGKPVVLTAGSMMKLGTIDNLKEETPNDLYVAYLHGYDLTFGDQVVNKATFGESILIKDKTQSITTDDVYFLDPSMTDAVLSNPSEGEYGRVIVIGRYNNQRSKLTRSGIYYFYSTESDNDLFLMANIEYEWPEFSSQTAKYQFYTKNQSITQETVIFDNCRLTSAAGGYNIKDYIQCSSKSQISNIQIVNCDIEAAGNSNVHNLIALGGGADCSSLVLRNNVIWNPDYANTTTKFQVAQLKNATNTKLSKLVLDANTFVHAYTTSNGYVYVQADQIAELTITNNLFYLPNHSTGYHNIVDFNQTTTSQVYRNNACVVAADAAGQIQMPTQEFPEGCEQVLSFKGVNPFATEDYENVIFVPTSEFSTYGAKR